MKPSGIGGQAVLEGIMMKNKSRYSVAVRKPDGEIEVRVSEHEGIGGGHAWAKLPLVRGSCKLCGFSDAWHGDIDLVRRFL